MSAYCNILSCIYKTKKLDSYLPKKNVVDLFADEGPEAEELAIDSVQNCLQAVPLPRILAIKQLQELEIRKSFINYIIFIISNVYRQNKTKTNQTKH